MSQFWPWLNAAALLIVLTICVPPLGGYMAAVFSGRSPLEGLGRAAVFSAAFVLGGFGRGAACLSVRSALARLSG